MYHYRCIGNIFVRGQVRCAANGSVGREDELVIGTASSPCSVLVVGGGPAGMEAARVASFARSLGDRGRRRATARWALGVCRGHVGRERRPAALARAPARAARGRGAPRHAARRRRRGRHRGRRGRGGHRSTLGTSRDSRRRSLPRAHGRRSGALAGRPHAAGGERRGGAGRRPPRPRGGRAGGTRTARV